MANTKSVSKNNKNELELDSPVKRSCSVLLLSINTWFHENTYQRIRSTEAISPWHPSLLTKP